MIYKSNSKYSLLFTVRFWPIVRGRFVSVIFACRTKGDGQHDNTNDLLSAVPIAAGHGCGSPALMGEFERSSSKSARLEKMTVRDRD